MTHSGKGFLVVKGTSGLGNRTLFFLSAALYARLSRRRIVVDWRDESYSEDGSNAFPALFDAPGVEPIERLPASEEIFPRHWAGRLERSFGSLRAELGPDAAVTADLSRLDYAEPVLVVGDYSPRIDVLRPHFSSLHGDLAALANEDILRRLAGELLIVQRDVARRAEALAADRLPGRAIGVHIRQSDMKAPIEAITSVVDRLVRGAPGAAVFLATDNHDVETMLRARYPVVVTADKWFPPAGECMHQNARACPDRRENAIEALVDVCLLARCDHLVYSARSTFGRLAALLSRASAGNRVNVDVDMDATTPGWKRVLRRLLRGVSA